MSYLVLARKYRPGSFSSVVGQEQVTRTLANAITRDRIGHAYLFTGPRGVGKTSIARIFAKCLNCEGGPTDTPCLECSNCKQIEDGTSLAVREIDGASHNSVDNVRELIESFRSVPPPGSKYKVYIIDEVHMFSVSAFNALLKSLEEPPPHTVFILATTEPHKIPKTVISRCQRFDFRAMTAANIQACLQSIADAEGITVQPSVFRVIARYADGSMRDAQSLLDRVRAFCDDTITEKEAALVLGAIEGKALFQLSAAILSRNPQKVLSSLQTALDAGLDPALLMREFVSHWGDLHRAKLCGVDTLRQCGVPEQDAEELLEQVAELSAADITDLTQMARKGCDEAVRSSYPLFAFEALVLQMSAREPVKSVGELIGYVRGVHAQVRSGKSSGGASQAKVHRPQGSSPQAGAPQRQAASRVGSDGSSRAAASQQAQAAAVAPVSPGSGASWKEFVAHVKSQKGGLMLATQLMRLSVDKFDGGVLALRGPQLTVAYVSEPEKYQFFMQQLNQFSPVASGSWQVTLTVGDSKGAAEVGSIVHDQKTERRVARDDRKAAAASHPKVQELTKTFAGSDVEAIRPRK